MDGPRHEVDGRSGFFRRGFFVNRRHLLGYLNRFLDLFLGDIDFRLENSDLRLDGSPNFCRRIADQAERFAQPLSKILHILWTQPGSL